MVIVSGRPSEPVTRTVGSISGSTSIEYSCCQPVRSITLVEISPPVEKADPHERERLIRGLFQHVSGEHPEASRVDGQRGVHTELGHKKATGRLPSSVAAGRARSSSSAPRDGVHTAQILLVGRRLEQGALGQVTQEADGVLPA